MFARLSQVFLAGAVGLLVWAACEALSSARTETPLLITWPSENLEGISTGKHDLAIRIENPGTIPRRVIGVLPECRANVCCEPKSQAPIMVPAGRTVGYHIELLVRRLGPFELPISLFFDDNGLRASVWYLRGVAVAEGGSSSGKGSQR